MEKSWFEMSEIKRRQFKNTVWIPLYACQQLECSGQIGYDGYKSEFFGCGSIAVHIEKKDTASKMGWDSIGIGYDSTPWIDDEGTYIASDICTDIENEVLGLRLVLRQETESSEPTELFLHQDFILGSTEWLEHLEISEK